MNLKRLCQSSRDTIHKQRERIGPHILSGLVLHTLDNGLVGLEMDMESRHGLMVPDMKVF